MHETDALTISLAQVAPVWINRQATLEKIADYLEQSAKEGADLVVFGEALVPGYPFWLDRLNGAAFNSDRQKTLFAHYADQAVTIESGHLDSICQLAKERALAVYLGIVERPKDRGGHSLYCSLVFINKKGNICSVHRKMMPTYEERLVWGIGDAHGLVTHDLAPFTVGGLNCWENWMPLARTALYAEGEDLHISVWPGNKRNTEDLLPVIAKESRSYVVGVSGIFRLDDIPKDFPFLADMQAAAEGMLADGGSCLAAPDGTWVIAPFTGEEELRTVTIYHERVREERQNFDSVGHYSRPDLLGITLNRERQSLVKSKGNHFSE